jgi:hypothetical protein
MNTLLNKKQSLEIALSLLSKEKIAADYGSAALSESKLIIIDMIKSIEMEEEFTKSQQPRNLAIKGPSTPEVYDELYPTPSKGEPPQKVGAKKRSLEKLNKKMEKQVLSLFGLEK